MEDGELVRVVAQPAPNGAWLGRLRSLALLKWPPALLVVSTICFRLPVLVNAAALNSDMAVVGLQARHILHGEWSWHLWGAGYQSSVDALLTAAVFALIGSSPLAFEIVPVIGHLAIVGLAFAVLRSKFSRSQAVL